jgi:hypothetical protein
MDPPATPPIDTAMDDFLAAAATICDKADRTDLAHRMRIARTRLHRSFTVVCIVGEYKQGKSALVNGMLGEAVCPVDDDLATAAITWIYPSEVPEARIRRIENHSRVTDEIRPDQVARYASERGNPDNAHRIELVEIGLPNPVLGTGLSIVDTPGTGGVDAARTAAILRFLPYVDTLIFATDASAELSTAEIEFLDAAHQACPNVLVALTKIDIYPQWRRIREIDAERLQEAGIRAVPLPVSAALRTEALRRGDSQLNEESGFPSVFRAIRTEVLGPSTRLARQRALSEAHGALSHLLAGADAERQAISDPADADRLAGELADIRNRIADLRKTGTRWATVLNDEITDVIQENDLRLRTGIQSILTDTDLRFSEADPAAIWDGFASELRESVATLVGDLLAEIDTCTDEISRRIAAMIEEAGAPPAGLSDPTPIDVDAIWTARDRPTPDRSGGGPAALLTALRGGTSGIITLGVIGGLAGLALAGPLSIGAGIAFGSKQYLDERKRRAERRRREARAVVQEFLGQVQLEAGARTRQVIQDNYRTLRDHFKERIAELDTTYAAAAARVQQSVQRAESDRQQRLPELEATIRRIGTMLRRADDLSRDAEIESPPQ